MNRNRNISFIIFLVLTINTAFSQEAGENPHKIRTVIKGNPFAILWGAIPYTSEYRIMAEYVMAKNQSVQLSYSYLGKSPVLSMLENAPSTGGEANFVVIGYRVQGWHKIYLTQFGNGYNKNNYLAPKGFYIASQISYATAKITNRYLNYYDIYIRATHVNTNFMVGAQMFLGNIAIDIFSGFGYKNNTWVERYSTRYIKYLNPDELGFGEYYKGPLKINFGFNLGYAL